MSERLDLIDRVIYATMRASNVNELVLILIPLDPPRIKWEYEKAYHYYFDMIISCQPNYTNQSMPRKEAIRIVKDCPLPPLELLGAWQRFVAMNIALREYQQAVAFVLDILEAGCQFRDDNVLLVAAKMGFGMGAFLLPIVPRDQQVPLGVVAESCKSLLQKDSEQCTQFHSKNVRDLCASFFDILSTLSTLHLTREDMIANQRKRMLVVLQPKAERIDSATHNRLNVKEWVNKTLSEWSPRAG